MALLTLALICYTTRAHAQVTTLRNLAFGTITSGTTTTLLPTSANAANWRIQGTISLGGGFQITLPTSLAGPGPALPITFTTTSGIYRVGTNSPVGGTTFNPNNFVSVTFLLSSVYVFLGASLNPPLNQTPGTYTGTVVLTTSGLL